MAWVAPRTWAATDLVTAAMLNVDVRDNPLALRAGGLALASQAANDILYASSATQLARLAQGTGLQVLRMNAGATAVEWGTVGPKAIYKGTISIADSATSGTAAISAVVLANTMIMNLGATGVTAGYDFNQAMVRLELTSTVLVTAYRGTAATGALTVGYCVVEWN